MQNAQRLGAITDNANSTNNCSLGVVEWAIFSIENAGTSGFNNLVLAPFAAHGLAGKRRIEVAVFTNLGKERKDFKRYPANHLGARKSGNAFHGRIPDGVSTFGIEPENAVGNLVENIEQHGAFKQACIRGQGSGCAGFRHSTTVGGVRNEN